MRFSLGCEIDYQLASDATLIFNIQAMRGDHQHIISENLALTPQVLIDEKLATDTGNRYLRLTAPAGPIKLRYDAEVELEALQEAPESIREIPVAELPLETMPYLNPSRYCQSDLLARFANRRFGGSATGHARVTEICNWIYGEVDYLFGSSDTSTTAFETFSTRAGVCRDFAHLGITFCRALGIPARFVSCYAWQLEPQDFHAVFEAWLGDRWYVFDPTRMAALTGMVRIGCGRDAADTAFASIYGQVTPGEMRVWIAALDGDTSDPWTTNAVSLSRV
jgi:transglutaminase-like putative cysteine protease